MAGSSSIHSTQLVEIRRALFIFGLCGLVGVLVDVDHAIAIILWRHIWPEIVEGRIWHTPLLVIVSCLICYLGTYYRGLYPKLVLMGLGVVAFLVLLFSPLVVWSWT